MIGHCFHVATLCGKNIAPVGMLERSHLQRLSAAGFPTPPTTLTAQPFWAREQWPVISFFDNKNIFPSCR